MSKYRILVVDDDPDIRFVISGLLGGDFEMVQAENGLDCLEKIERYEPDLVLMDISMPVMDGFAACLGVRRHQDFDQMPVFFLTGASSEGARARAAEVGSQGFIEKPFRTDELVASIREFFFNHRQPPRLKTFTIRELRRIDETPLRAADVIAESPAAAGPEVIAASALFEEETAADEGRAPRKRRVFGAVRRERPPDAPPTALPEDAEDESWKTAKIRPGKPAPPPPAAPAPRTEPPPPPPTAKAEPPSPPPEPVVRPSRPIPPEAVKGRSAAGKAAAAQRPRVLCMIDEREEAQEYAHALKGAGEFLPLEDPVEAVEIIAKFQPDVVFLRVAGTNYNGIQIVQLLRGNPRLSHISAVFLHTGRETPATMTAARRLTPFPTIPAPAQTALVAGSLRAVTSAPGFAVRLKNHAYGVFVKEVLQRARHVENVQRAQMEKEAYARKTSYLAGFMEKELRGLAAAAEEEKLDPGDRRNRAQNYYMS
jgi:CheY-like chemotaxis protein